MSRFISWQLGAWLALAGIFVWSGSSSGEGDVEATTANRVASRTEAVDLALDQTVTFNFEETPLADVMQFIDDRQDVNVVIDRVALESVGVALDVPITKRLHNISLRSALNLCLRDLDLTFVNHDEVLLITTIDEADQMLTTKVYPIRDLALPPSGAGEEDYDSLIDAITSTIATTTWDDVGGPGSIQPVPNAGAMVISQTQQTHEEVSKLFKSLRETRAKQYPQHAGTLGSR